MSKVNSHEQSFLEGKRKTALCKDWLDGECPRGRSCKFAHGEAELEGHSLIEVLQERQREKAWLQREERDTYVESVSENYYQDEDLAAMVQEGLDARVRKRRRTGKHDKGDDNQDEQSKEVIFEGDFPIMCVNGDVDVTGCLTKSKLGLRRHSSRLDRLLPMSRNFTFGTAVVPGLALFCAGTNWHYEVTLLTAGLMQIGWATSKFLDVKNDYRFY